jgi:hypothetical protein
VLLSKITADPARFQFRDGPFSARTVAAIVAEGVDVAKFDPLPLLKEGRGYVVAGDGHSRFEALRQLAPRLPRAWKRGRDWDVPARVITPGEARRLAWTANLNRHNFTPCEEAKVFAAMLASGMTMAEVAAEAQRSEVYVTNQLKLNTLARDIRAMVGAAPEAGGIDQLTAQVLATGFARHGIDVTTQQQLWHCFLKSAQLNFQSAKKLVDRIGARLAEKSGGDEFLFSIPANAGVVLQEARERGSACRSAKMGLSLLVKALAAGGLEDYPELAAWVGAHGQAAIDALAERVTEDADLLAGMIEPPKVWKARPADATDALIARQYHDVAATAPLF